MVVDGGATLADWRFSSRKSHIARADQMEAIAQATGVTSLPEMVYADNFLRIEHVPSGATIAFEAAPAIAACAKSTHDRVQVAVAEQWASASAARPEASCDWTFSSDYSGTTAPAWPWVDNPGFAIDTQMLTRPDPIQWYDDVVLFEDELHDHGVSVLSVRVRVMPQCFLVLMRHWLRIDGVMMRVQDTRVFHDIGKPVICREVKLSEATFHDLQSRGHAGHAAQYPNADAALPYLALKRRTMQTCCVPIVPINEP
ncbi:unnamed protein product (mitochondrion) [Plasmodiophora brassicae]|uniref:TIP41-like protein n=1 Tax=Plasmodiophora brassicae TaxID=37360 RepID=A0A0G4IT37_PLABS|nr:hypothetical protein PBRA_006544 [Plasmodiophora brassicae]SPQ94513.1 unnamed protein product [Plasmodiophora brassicae]